MSLGKNLHPLSSQLGLTMYASTAQPLIALSSLMTLSSRLLITKPMKRRKFLSTKHVGAN